MSLNHPTPGENYSPAYQISAMPFLSSSNLTAGEVLRVDFGFISRFIQVKNRGAAGTSISLGFTENGLTPAKGNYYVISPGETLSAEIRCTSVFLSASAGTPSFSLMAGLTTIPEKAFTPLTGSNGYPGVG